MSSDNVDRLSTLPEEITSHILSLMPTKFAVRTSILSTRWRYSWTSITNLHFEDLHPHLLVRLFGDTDSEVDDNQLISISDKFKNFVDRVLESCRSPQIQLFRLHLNPLHSFGSKCLSNWIDKAVRLNVCELDIETLIEELPLNLLTCKTLTKLRLDYCGPWADSLWEPPSQPVNLPCLKTLDIVVHSNPFADAFKLINGCPILESLSLVVKCREDEEDYIFNLPTLKRLKLTFESVMNKVVLHVPNLEYLFGASVMNKVVLHVPNLEYLFVGGRLYSVFVMEDVSSLVEASLSLDCSRMDHQWIELLKGLNRVKSLSAQSSSFLYLEKPQTCSMPIFLNLEHLELKGSCCPQLVHWFLESSPQLKHLCIEKAERFYWTELVSVPSCMLTDLVTIKLLQCNGHITDMEFLKYMLQNGEVLKTVTIAWTNICTEEQMRIAVEVLNFPRASSHCEIYFV